MSETLNPRILCSPTDFVYDSELPELIGIRLPDQPEAHLANARWILSETGVWSPLEVKGEDRKSVSLADLKSGIYDLGHPALYAALYDGKGIPGIDVIDPTLIESGADDFFEPKPGLTYKEIILARFVVTHSH